MNFSRVGSMSISLKSFIFALNMCFWRECTIFGSSYNCSLNLRTILLSLGDTGTDNFYFGETAKLFNFEGPLWNVWPAFWLRINLMSSLLETKDGGTREGSNPILLFVPLFIGVVACVKYLPSDSFLHGFGMWYVILFSTIICLPTGGNWALPDFMPSIFGLITIIPSLLEEIPFDLFR